MVVTGSIESNVNRQTATSSSATLNADGRFDWQSKNRVDISADMSSNKSVSRNGL